MWLAFAGALAGVAVALGFEPFGWWPLVFLGVAGLTLAVRGADRWLPIGLGWAFGLGVTSVGLSWMVMISIEALVGLIVVTSAWYALLGWGLRIASTSRWWPVLGAGVWTLVEYAFARFPFNGFGWLRLGYAMVDSPLAGLLPLAGVAGVGFVTAFLSQLLAWLVERPNHRRLLAASGVLAATLAISTAGLLLLPSPSDGRTAAVAWVQGGAPGGGVYGLGPPRTITQNQWAETLRLAARIDGGEAAVPDFVVWPENSTDLDPSTDQRTGDLVTSAMAGFGRPILVGAIVDGPGPGERQTAAQWWDPQAGVVATYVKRSIVPFGEWIPFREVLLPLIPELGYVGAQSVPGRRPGVLPVNLGDGRPISVGVLICFDLAFDQVVYDTVRAGGEVLVAQSSNAMYQGSGQVEQQFAITRARAAELRREVLVVTTSGVSGLIDASGSVSWRVGDPGAASGVVRLPLRSGLTPAVWLAPAAEALLALAAGVWVALLLSRGGRSWELGRLVQILTRRSSALGAGDAHSAEEGSHQTGGVSR